MISYSYLIIVFFQNEVLLFVVMQMNLIPTSCSRFVYTLKTVLNLLNGYNKRDKYTPGEMQDEMIKIMQLCHNTIAV